MQFHVCLFLFLITTAKILAWSDQRCGGNVYLDQEPFGNITLSLLGLFNDSSPMNQSSDETSQLLNCTWVLDVPLGRTLLVKVVLLESDWRIFLRCVCCEEELDLQSGETARLSGCDRDKATISWTGAGRSSDSVQLVYYVQENERNSSEGRSSLDPSGWSETGTTIKTVATDAQEVEKSTEEGRRPLYEDLLLSSSSQFVSSASSLGDGPLPTVSPQQGLPVSGRADKETLPLPEEKLNNRTETSGASHLTSDLTSAQTLSYFRYAGLKTQTETPFLTQTETPRTDSFVSVSTVLPGHAQTDQRVSSSSELILSPSRKPTWERNTTSFPHGGAITQTPEDKQALSWTSQQSVGRFNSDLTSATISDSLISTKPPQHDSDIVNTENQPTSFSAHAPSRTQSPHTHITAPDSAVGTVAAALLHPHSSRGDSFRTDVSTHTAASEDVDHTLTPSTRSQTSSPESTETLVPSTLSLLTPTIGEGMQKDVSDKNEGPTAGLTGSFPTTGGAQTRKIPESTAAAPKETHTALPEPTDSTTTDSHTSQTHFEFPHTASTSFFLESSSNVTSVDHKTNSVPSRTSHSPHTHHLPSSTNIPTYKQSPDSADTVYTSLTSTIKSHYGEKKARKDDEFFPGISTKQSKTFRPTSHRSMQNHLDLTPSDLTPPPVWSSTISPMFYIVPNQPATIRVESVELLLQIVVEESSSALVPGLEEETAAWVLPYLQRAPGFSKLLGVWSSGHAVQSLVVFKTSGALQWLSMRQPMSLLERTGLAQAVHEGRMFRSSNITNITLGGLQGDVCNWLLQCPAGYKCVREPSTTNYSCSSVCRFDFCHHHGICTHHPGQLPVCRCLVGEDFWYMGQRCDVRMTQVRLVGACLAILLIIATVIGILALVAVRRYRTILIQAKVDQTRSSYRKFNHFDELSGRFWLRSWAGSADSLDNPAFTRSDELLHLRALDRTCCYHDDTLSLASTCPSRGAHINTIYPHSSQYGWRGSEVSVGDGVLDSGKASDLSVCSWPVEPIHWTPFPLLQQLASHRTQTVRVSRPRSYCEGMELVDLGKSWTA